MRSGRGAVRGLEEQAAALDDGPEFAGCLTSTALVAAFLEDDDGAIGLGFDGVARTGIEAGAAAPTERGVDF